jgi:hypothetical protein
MVVHGFIAGRLGARVDLNCFLPRERNSNTAPLKKKTTTEQQGGENIMHQSTTLAHNFSCGETINNKQIQQQKPSQKPQHDTAVLVRAKSPGESGQGI